MIEYDEALALVRRHAPGPTGVEEVPLVEATGRVLAEPVSAGISSPHFNAAAMDGLAVKAEVTFGASESMPKKLTIVPASPSEKINLEQTTFKPIRMVVAVTTSKGKPDNSGICFAENVIIRTAAVKNMLKIKSTSKIRVDCGNKSPPTIAIVPAAKRKLLRQPNCKLPLFFKCALLTAIYLLITFYILVIRQRRVQQF